MSPAKADLYSVNSRGDSFDQSCSISEKLKSAIWPFSSFIYLTIDTEIHTHLYKLFLIPFNAINIHINRTDCTVKKRTAMPGRPSFFFLYETCSPSRTGYALIGRHCSGGPMTGQGYFSRKKK